MKTYTLSFGQAIDHKPDDPGRTARRVAGNGDDITFGVWTNRTAMLKSIDIQNRGVPTRPWKAVLA